MTDGPKAAQGFVEPRERSGKLSIFLRLTRAQFLPLIILPVSVGTALAYSSTHSTNAELFGLALAGSVFLHLGANAIDDCYDYENGVDSKADSMFPKDFEGWKPIPRNLISLPVAKALSFLLLGLSLSFGVYLSIRVGYWALILGLIGFRSETDPKKPHFTTGRQSTILSSVRSQPFFWRLPLNPSRILGPYSWTDRSRSSILLYSTTTQAGL